MQPLKKALGWRKALVALLFLPTIGTHAQIAYEFPGAKSIGVGSYGRVGVDWSFENNGSMGRRLNLNNMGSQGGRLEEQDYFELAMAAKLSNNSNNDNSNLIYVQTRLSVYSTGQSSMGNSTSTSIHGLAFALPDLFVEAKNIGNSGVNMWVGARLYRGPDVHIADYRYFNDHSGQGFGVEYKKTRFVGLFVASTDTSSTLPPYFYLDIATGTPSAEMRGRTVWALEHDIDITPSNKLTLLAEAHKLGNGGFDANDQSLYNYPTDFGYLLGVRLESTFGAGRKSFNRFSARYGRGIANGGDGGSTKSWLTFGAPDTIALNYRHAYSVNIVNDLYHRFNEKNSIEAYGIYAMSKGGASTNGMAPTFWGREVYNRKRELAVGIREMYQPYKYLRFLFEAHYAQRQDGENDFAKMTKLSFAPVLIPSGSNDFWARPEIRFVSSVAFYNDFAKNNMYSPYLEMVGPKSVGYYFGIKVEWWLWG
jgi:maltoporin